MRLYIYGYIIERVGVIWFDDMVMASDSKCLITLNIRLTPLYFKCYPTVALWLQKPSKNEIICKNNRKIVLEIVTVEEEN